MTCLCGPDLNHRVIVHERKLYCEQCGYPLPDDDLRQNEDGRRIVNGWVTYPGVNRAGF